MAKSSKTIRKRIKSVTSTKKITRTMEMVATSKLQKTQGKVVGSRPYTTTLASLLEVLSGAVGSLGNFPLFERRTPTKRVLVLLITSNRGLCGGYNANLVRKAREHVNALRAEGLEVVPHVAGKKGIAALRFAGVELAGTRTDLTDAPTYAEAESLGRPLIEAFLKYDVDRVDVVYADFRSVSQQPPTALTLLPLGADTGTAGGAAGAGKTTGPKHDVQFLFEPAPAEILAELATVYVKNVLFRILVSAVASEQLARRVAMKNATDNASEMQKSLTREYNKARQAMITQEIAEIVGGAAALE